MNINNHTYYQLLGVALLSFLIMSCTKISTNVKVKHSGALRNIMSGNIEATISLDTLSQKEHFYALGAVADLKGEIQIFDSQPHNSVVIDNNISITDSYAMKAALLVYAEVETWNGFNIENVKTKVDLEKRIFETAKSNGINVQEPFPFLLEGEVSSLDWHVINWKDGDTDHNHDKHKQSGLNGSLDNNAVEIIGFYSTKHKAVFTHHSTNIHMHFKTEDNKLSGHVDDLILNKKMSLKLPKR
ncbi:decarboxylase [Maribacter algarum]|uniref:Decarboxylase n=1 Tax=Maribacter algarum (ex Zhang et al. 2020) TaxID=2578118 RepID=A0A5S3PH26_9FLAO|nr:acetolactate decarboxylase [Maribacter algarum]TMM53432.1 decarboxylase [Maribacter algarum]